MKNKTHVCAKAGFTLVELLVVIVIIAALAAVAFSLAGRMRQRGEIAKSIQDMRQISVLSGMYSVENSDKLPPMQSEKKNDDGSTSTLQWNLLLLSQVYPDNDPFDLKNVSWWKANEPFMLNRKIVNNLKTDKFSPEKCGYGMNKWIQYNLIPNGGNDWVLGSGGRQSLGVPRSAVERPSRTPLYTSVPDFLYDGPSFNRVDCKPLLLDGKVPITFVDNHVEIVPIKAYTALNYDHIKNR